MGVRADESFRKTCARFLFFGNEAARTAWEIEFLITVKEYAVPSDRRMHFFALADKQTNQDGRAVYSVRMGRDVDFRAFGLHSGAGTVSVSAEKGE